MIYRVFEETYSGSKIIAEVGSLLLAKMFIKMQHPDAPWEPSFLDAYYQSWDLESDPKYFMTTVECEGIKYEIYPVEDKSCLECGQD